MIVPFFMEGTIMDLALASLLAGYADRAYRTATFRNGYTQGFVESTADSCTLAFRGTDEPGDWLVNLDACPDRHLEGYLHRGFVGALESVWGQILRQLDGEPRHLRITGHSLGGALAMLAAVRLVQSGLYRADEVDVVTFGQPRVGDRSFGRTLALMGLKICRIANDGDPVPWVPPVTTPAWYLTPCLYWHTGSVVLLKTDGSYSESPGWFKLTADWCRSWMPGMGNLQSRIGHHFMSEYIRRLGLAYAAGHRAESNP